MKIAGIPSLLFRFCSYISLFTEFVTTQEILHPSQQSSLWRYYFQLAQRCYSQPGTLRAYKPDDPSGDIEFELKHFISVYSALLHLQPDIIYLHTDESYTSIERAQDSPLASAPNKWAHLILNLPSVVVQRVSPPATASGTGVAITRLEHKSDFVRAEVVYEHGGMYLDFDVYALRDVKHLREAGFANVLGRQKHGQVNSGCWMSQKGSLLMKMWVEGQHEVYDGRWTTHSNDLLTSLSDRNGDGGLLTSLAEYLMPGEKEVGDDISILDAMAFGPSS